MSILGAVSSVTRILYGNWFSQGHNELYDTRTAIVGNVFYININGNPMTGSGAEQRVQMPNSGKFVGLIIHVGTNDSTSGTSEYSIRASRKSDDYATEATLATVVIPTGETGCFYSDPDTSDGVRAFFRYDALSFTKLKPTGSNSKGCSDIDFCLGLDMDSSFGTEGYYTG